MQLFGNRVSMLPNMSWPPEALLPKLEKKLSKKGKHFSSGKKNTRVIKNLPSPVLRQKTDEF
jgi:hypothetical protein